MENAYLILWHLGPFLLEDAIMAAGADSLAEIASQPALQSTTPSYRTASSQLELT